MIDARDIWNAIKARFGGNVESKKMKKSLLKQKFEEFKKSEEKGLDKGYDKMQKILSQMNTLKIKPKTEDVNMKFLRGLPPSWSGIALILKTKGGLEYISFDDLYNKLKFLEIDTKGYSSSPSTLSNAAFVSTARSSQGNLSYQDSGNDGYGGYTTTLSASPGSLSFKGSSKSQCSVVDDVIYSFFVNHKIDQQLVYKDLDQMNKEEFKEYDLNHQMAMLSIKKTEGGNTEPRSLENFCMIAGIKIESDADSEGEVVSAADDIHAGVSVPAGTIAAAVVSPQFETEFALMCLSTEDNSLTLEKAKDRGIVDSGCSRRKISGKGTIKTKNLNFKNILYVKELQHFNLISVSQICDRDHRVLFTKNECLVLSKYFPLPDPSMVILSILRKHNLYTFSLNELAPKGPLTFLIAKASQNESTLWHRRLGHVNFRNMNKLVKGNLVRGLPSKVFQNNHTRVACNKGKQHKASYKTIPSISLITEPLHLLHMDLFGPTSVRSINKKYYCLVIIDEYTRFSWVYFLEHKSDTFLILKNFITLMENQFNHKVKAIRCDNGTEFKNANLIEFCGSKGIRQDYSNARTPQQNGVVERKNQTLIEAARTMLADSLLPTIFWSEAVATACYVLNRVLVTKPHHKTPYELLTGDKPSISYLKPFGYHVTILNTSDSLGKLDKKSNEGYIVGYSISSKAYRVYNLVSRKIDETMNLNFLENKPFVARTGQAWMFNIDYLSNSLNYSRVSSTNLTVGSQGATPSNAGSQKDDSDSNDEPDVLIIQSTPTPMAPIVDEATTQNDGKKEADRLGLVFPSLNLILGVGTASIGSSISAGRPVSAGNPTGSAGRPVSADRPSGSAARTPIPVGRILGKLPSNTPSERFPRASSVENLDIHDGLKIFDCPKSEAMQAEIQQFRNQKVWVLVTLPDRKRSIGTKWILKNKIDAMGIVCKNKARLVAQGHRQEEGIDYIDVFTPVARIEAI
nr:putative ribonuclease H-like domain-containing protein [Tanacetum cinerariifolium]